MQTIAQEVRQALRRLRSSPAFTIAATLTLAVAIGATTSVFSVVDGVGILLGSSAAWVLTRILAGLFLGISPHDPGIFVGAAMVFTVVDPARTLGAS